MSPKVFFIGDLPSNITTIVQASSTVILKTIALTNTLDDWANVQIEVMNGQTIFGLFNGQMEPKDTVLIESTLVLETGMSIRASGNGVKAYIVGVETA